MSDSRKQSRDTQWICGRHAVKAVLCNEHREILRVIVLGSCKHFLDEFYGKNGRQSIKAEVVDKDCFSAIFGKDAVHQGCAVLARNMRIYSVEELIIDENDDRPFVFLDHIEDPQNVGSILRASAAFNARAVVLTENHSPSVTASLAKAASGALEFVPLIRVVNLCHTINFLKKHNFWCFGLDEKAEKTANEVELSGKSVFIIGGEGGGMRRLTRESCDFLIKLPTNSCFSTMNAAQAAVVTLYESFRQRNMQI